MAALDVAEPDSQITDSVGDVPARVLNPCSKNAVLYKYARMEDRVTFIVSFATQGLSI